MLPSRGVAAIKARNVSAAVIAVMKPGQHAETLTLGKRRVAAVFEPDRQQNRSR